MGEVTSLVVGFDGQWGYRFSGVIRGMGLQV